MLSKKRGVNRMKMLWLALVLAMAFGMMPREHVHEALLVPVPWNDEAGIERYSCVKCGETWIVDVD